MAPRRKRQKRWLKWLAFLLLVGLAVLVVYLVWDSYFKEKPESSKEVEKPVLVVEDKVEDVEEEVETQEFTQKEEVVQYEGENPNELEMLTGVVTYAGVSGDNLLIRVNIDQYLTGGSCELALLAGGVSVYGDTAEIMDAASTSTCAGFNVPLSKVSGSDLEIVVYLAADGKVGEIRGEVKI